MKTLKLITLSLLLSITFFSCNSDDDNPSIEPTTKERLAHKWFLLKVLNVETGEETIADSCEQNSYYEFSITGDFSLGFFALNTGTCELNSSESGTYEMMEHEGDEGFLITLPDGSTEGSKIVSISETELVLEQTGFGTRHITFIKE